MPGNYLKISSSTARGPNWILKFLKRGGGEWEPRSERSL